MKHKVVWAFHMALRFEDDLLRKIPGNAIIYALCWSQKTINENFEVLVTAVVNKVLDEAGATLESHFCFWNAARDVSTFTPGGGSPEDVLEAGEDGSLSSLVSLWPVSYRGGTSRQCAC